jgi:uncharacterized protein (TIGR02246 family)
MIDTLERDEREIRGILARLALTADAGDLEEYVSLFAEEAVWSGDGAPMRSGRDEILKGALERRAAGTTGPGSHTIHVVSTIDVQLEGERATARSVFQFYVDTHESPRLAIIGHYFDEFRREGSEWKLALRRIVSG